MSIEITSPCCLPLGLVMAEGKPALLGITLQYPPIQMSVRPRDELSVTGGRANIAREQALRWFEHHGLAPQGEIEIELAIPAHMGLGGEAMMGLSVAKGLRGLAGLEDPHGLGEEIGLGSEWALEAWSHGRGGVLVAGTDGSLIRRHELKHDDKHTWVFVIHTPHAPKDTPQFLEKDRRLALVNAEATRDIEPLWAAIVSDDIGAFANELMQLQASARVSDEAQAMMAVMREAGALACGQSMGGLAVWALVKGGKPSYDLRTKMRARMGHGAGAVTAAITDNEGSKVKRA
ncbi:MAG: hypothetical protein FJ030_02905 [Chloroflexi bacterium]|nr:hypothetical protein [Chloroflexota bacterium]